MNRGQNMLIGIVVLGSALGMPSETLAELPPVETIGGVSLPAVPASVATAAVEAAAAERERLAAEENESEGSARADPPMAIEVTPGTTEILRIARNYLNRLMTPFEDPRVLTVNSVEVRKEGSSVFLATSAETPVGVHILSSDPEDSRGISLTLVPARIPPKTIELKWRGAANDRAARPMLARAKRWEESAPYVQKLLELAELIARGEVPQGYSLSEHDRSDLKCAMPGLTFEPGQRLTGARFSVFVLRVTNGASFAVELKGSAGCSAPGMVLVAPWPEALLEPGASSELYVVVNNEAFETQPTGQHRPSLLESAP